MSSVTIITSLFRASHVHLDKRKKFNDADEPAFRVAALFPQSGVGEIPALGIQFDSSPQNIIDAIKEVVMTEWNWEYDAENEQANKTMGVQFPPMYKDGNTVPKKDTNGNPIPNEFCPISADNFIFNLKNVDDVACGSGKDLSEIATSAPYSGCWGRAQLEISAFTTKGTTPSRIISIKMVNFLMCYDDESFGGRGPVQSVDQAFAGMQVTDSNLSVATGKSSFRPEPSNKTPMKPVPKSTTGTVTINASSDYTYDELKNDFELSDQDMIDQGFATKAMAKPTPKPMVKKPVPKPKMPVKKVSATGTVTMNSDSDYTYEQLKSEFELSDQDMIDQGFATKAIAKPTPKPKPKMPVKKTPVKPTLKSVPTTGTVIMNPDSEYTYEQLSVEFEWSDEDIVNGGYAKPNFTNVQ